MANQENSDNDIFDTLFKQLQYISIAQFYDEFISCVHNPKLLFDLIKDDNNQKLYNFITNSKSFKTHEYNNFTQLLLLIKYLFVTFDQDQTQITVDQVNKYFKLLYDTFLFDLSNYILTNDTQNMHFFIIIYLIALNYKFNMLNDNLLVQLKITFNDEFFDLKQQIDNYIQLYNQNVHNNELYTTIQNQLKNYVTKYLINLKIGGNPPTQISLKLVNDKVIEIDKVDIEQLSKEILLNNTQMNLIDNYNEWVSTIIDKIKFDDENDIERFGSTSSFINFCGPCLLKIILYLQLQHYITNNTNTIPKIKITDVQNILQLLMSSINDDVDMLNENYDKITINNNNIQKCYMIFFSNIDETHLNKLIDYCNKNLISLLMKSYVNDDLCLRVIRVAKLILETNTVNIQKCLLFHFISLITCSNTKINLQINTVNYSGEGDFNNNSNINNNSNNELTNLTFTGEGSNTNYNMKTLINEIVDDLNSKYNNNILQMYISHIIPTLALNKKTTNLNTIKKNIINYISNNKFNLDKQIEKYIKQIKYNITSLQTKANKYHFNNSSDDSDNY